MLPPVARVWERRISRRIAVVVGSAVVLAGIGGLLLVHQQNVDTQRALSERYLRSISESVAASFRTYDARLGQHPAADLAVDIGERGEAVLEVFDHEGKIRWSSDPRRLQLKIDPRLLALTASTAVAQVLTSEHQVQMVRALRRTSQCLPCHQNSPDPIGGIRVAAARPDLLTNARGFLASAGAAVLLACALLTGLLLFMLNRLVVARIGRLATAMTRAEKGDYLVRAPVDTTDELGQLASTFNRMLAKITDLRVQSIESEREMEQVRVELELKSQLSEKSELLEATNQRLQARVSELQFLNQLSRDLAAKLDLEYLLERFCERVSTALHIPEIAVLVFDRGRGQVRSLKTHGLSAERQVNALFDASSSISGEAITHRQAIYVADLTQDARILAYRKDPRGSLYVVPLVYQEEVIGLLNFSSPTPDAFRPEERDLLSIVAGQAALALAHAQLFQETLELSVTDGLTGLLNRRAVDARLELEWSRAERDKSPFSVVVLDIDHFKEYNQQHGHQVGDEALRRLAHILESLVRPVDTTARYGGEEFMILLHGTNKTQAVEFARKLRRSVEQADFARGYLQPEGRVTISCGVATSTEDAQNASQLASAADQALRAAKNGGTNQIATLEGIDRRTYLSEPITPDPEETF